MGASRKTSKLLQTHINLIISQIFHRPLVQILVRVQSKMIVFLSPNRPIMNNIKRKKLKITMINLYKKKNFLNQI